MKKYLPVLMLLMIPAVALMFRYGIFTMHDFHLFRQYEFSRCFSAGIFPCRWAADAGMGYGEPLFVFYGQFPYWTGQLFRSLSFSIIDSTKAVFVLSLLGSGFTMFIFARRYWGNLGALISGIFYVYAPYRAVDVWVRGALPEALSFVLFPLIFYFLDRYLYLKQIKYLLYFSLSYALLIINHNLSVYMITPFLVLFWLFHSVKNKYLSSLVPVGAAGIYSLLLSAFYLLPVVAENSLTTVSATTQAYYNYQLHYATLYQLFISRLWGYGGSVWGPNDTLSFSVGLLHWLIPVLIVILALFNSRNRNRIKPVFYLSIFLGIFSLFLTHGKSEFIWKIIPGMSFVQFPWRFLSPAVFFLSFASGQLAGLSIPGKKLAITLIVFAVIFINFNYFRPDIWRSIGDKVQFSGQLWNEQRSSALQDFWPKSAPDMPVDFARSQPWYTSGQGFVSTWEVGPQSADYLAQVISTTAKVSVPIVYFPGWVARVDNQIQSIIPDQAGLISLSLPLGEHHIALVFTDTPARYWGNIISLVMVTIWLLSLFIAYRYEK